MKNGEEVLVADQSSKTVLWIVLGVLAFCVVGAVAAGGAVWWLASRVEEARELELVRAESARAESDAAAERERREWAELLSPEQQEEMRGLLASQTAAEEFAGDLLAEEPAAGLAASDMAPETLADLRERLRQAVGAAPRVELRGGKTDGSADPPTATYVLTLRGTRGAASLRVDLRRAETGTWEVTGATDELDERDR